MAVLGRASHQYTIGKDDPGVPSGPPLTFDERRDERHVSAILTLGGYPRLRLTARQVKLRGPSLQVGTVR
jgi:hypothetical protein